MGEDEVAAARRRAGWRGSSSGQRSATSAMNRSDKAPRLGLEVGHRHPVEGRQPRLERGHRDDRRRPGLEARDAGGGAIIGFEGERLGMAEPARQRRGELVLQRFGDEQEGRRAGAAVEIFIAAPDREIGARAVEVDRHRAGAVRQVPQHQRAGGVRGGGERGHVVAAGAAIIDVRSASRPRCRRRSRRRSASASTVRSVAPSQSGEPLRDVEVAREIALLAQDRRSPGARGERGGEQFEQVDRGRIGDQHLVRPAPRSAARCGRRAAAARRSSHACSSWR